MPIIGVTSPSADYAQSYVEAVRRWGAETQLLLPGETRSPQEILSAVDGLLLCGGPDVDPAFYGEKIAPAAKKKLKGVNPRLDKLELCLLCVAMERDMPILGICRGMQVLNVAVGGKLILDLSGHSADDQDVSAYHDVRISPGSKLAAAIGSGGTVRVNSRHHQGLREAHKAPSLLASAYSPDDHLIEALESPRHRWVLGVQWHPERVNDEVPQQFQRLFQALVEKASERAASRV